MVKYIIIGLVILLILVLVMYFMGSNQSGDAYPPYVPSVSAPQNVSQLPYPPTPQPAPYAPYTPAIQQPDPLSLVQPVFQPTPQPSPQPVQPTPQPVFQPTPQPTPQPTQQPVLQPAPSMPIINVAEPSIAVSTKPPLILTSTMPVSAPMPTAAPLDTTNLTKYIRVSKSAIVENNDNDSFQLAELVIKTSDKQITASDIAGVTSSASGYGSKPSLIVDGNTNAMFFGGSVWHSDNVSKPRWIMVTLTNPMKVSSIRVYNRADCCWDRLKGAKLELLNADNNVIKSVTLTSSLIQDYSF